VNPLAVLRAVYRKRRYWKWLIRDESRNPFHPGWGERWRAWRAGFLSRNYRWFGLDGRDASEYLTDRARYLRTTSLNEPYASVLDDKLLFHEVFRRHEGLMPETYALLRRGRVLPMSARERVGSLDDVLRLFAARGRLVLKGTSGGGGAGVAVLRRAEPGGGAILDGAPIDEESLRRRLSALREHLVMEYVDSAAYSRAIFHGSSNTVRILTVWEEDTGQAFAPYAIHRFGTSRSRGVDNFARGGVAAWIDAESGAMGPVIGIGGDGRPTYSPVHPETGARVEGVVVPRWAEAVERILALAREHPYLPYVGWDLVITDDGIRVFEGNSFTGYEVFQLQRPFLSHPRLRRYLQRRGVIR
jgi:hypothetical protein